MARAGTLSAIAVKGPMTSNGSLSPVTPPLVTLMTSPCAGVGRVAVVVLVPLTKLVGVAGERSPFVSDHVAGALYPVIRTPQRFNAVAVTVTGAPAVMGVLTRTSIDASVFGFGSGCHAGSQSPPVVVPVT